MAYKHGGSFGLENDLVRLHVPLSLAAGALLFAALATPVGAAFALCGGLRRPPIRRA